MKYLLLIQLLCLISFCQAQKINYYLAINYYDVKDPVSIKVKNIESNLDTPIEFTKKDQGLYTAEGYIVNTFNQSSYFLASLSVKSADGNQLSQLILVCDDTTIFDVHSINKISLNSSSCEKQRQFFEYTSNLEDSLHYFQDLFISNKKNVISKDSIKNKYDIFLQQTINNLKGNYYKSNGKEKMLFYITLGLISDLIEKNEFEYLKDVCDRSSAIMPKLYSSKICNAIKFNELRLNDTIPKIILDSILRQINLKSISSDLIYIDFWATWCGPCIKEIEKLKKIYDSEEFNKMSIISISIDDSRDRWQDYLNKNLDMKWFQIWDKESFFKNSFGLNHIPTSYLLNKDGLILGVNLSEDEIRKELK